MGLPLAPKQARMTTAILLINYHLPPQQAIKTILTTWLLRTLLSWISFNPLNWKKDLKIPHRTSFTNLQTAFMFKSSNHLSKNMVTSTWKAAVLKSAMIAIYPATALENHYRREMPHYMRVGYNLSDLDHNIAELCILSGIRPRPQPQTTAMFHYYSQTSRN